MQYAITEDGHKVEPHPHGKAFCPGCKTLVTAKCGPTNVWHWSHESLEECDTWNYEPKSQWHLSWQHRFHKDDIEVIIKKEDKYHIADIIGNNDVVIEIQNSPISADEIFEREVFYGKMLWVLNGRRFAHNLQIEGYDVNIDSSFLRQFIIYEENKNGVPLTIKLIAPIDDDGAIHRCLNANKILYRQDEEDENTWYITDPEKLNGYELPVELRAVYVSYALHHEISMKIEEDANYPIFFKWRYAKRSWLNAQKPIFIDIGHTYLIYLIKVEGSVYFKGKIVSKQKFLNKYRKRLPY